MKALQATLACLVLLAFSSTAAAQSRLPGSLEAAVHAKILSFDRSLANSSASLVIGVVYDPDSALSTVTATNIIEGFENLKRKRLTVHSRSLSVVRIPISGDVDRALRKQTLHAIYVAADMDSQVPKIATSAARQSIRTLSGNRAYVRSGLAIAVVEKNKRPSIVLSIGNAKRCGMSLDPRLVRLAEIIR